jgi:hypothetical protein
VPNERPGQSTIGTAHTNCTNRSQREHIERKMAEILVSFDISEEQQKNANRIVDHKTSFRKIQNLVYLKCKS